MLGPRQTELVTALRSGNYQQTTGLLRDDGGFCCLGVACDITHLGQWVPVPAAGEENLSYGYVTQTGDTRKTAVGHLSESIKQHYEFKSAYGDNARATGPDPGRLTSLNDEKGWTFAQIADYIEANAEGLFYEPV